MKSFDTIKICLALSVAGTAFAGYLSAIKFFSGVCAFNEPCPYFLGYPSCWYGFAMFLALTVACAVGLARRFSASTTLRIVAAIAALGTLFAGYFVANEVLRWLTASVRYALVLPTCVYGLIFYVIILMLSLHGSRTASREE